MENQETVEPEEVVPSEEIAEQPQEALEVEQEQEETQVPLHALQKERRKRQEAEERIRLYEEQKLAEADDSSRYDSATKEDLGKTQEETLRIIEERKWARDNPELFQKINDELPGFLKRSPNLASAIESATNRYEEAWELMSALTPKQQKQLSQAKKQEAPGSPSGIPKAAAMSDAVDLMSMSDAEFNAWRKEKRGGR